MLLINQSINQSKIKLLEWRKSAKCNRNNLTSSKIINNGWNWEVDKAEGYLKKYAKYKKK